MPPAIPRCRPFGLGDAMILTAALAAWLGFLRIFVQAMLRTMPNPGDLLRLSGLRRHWVDLAFLVSSSLVPLLVLLTLAFFVIRFRPPCPPPRQLLRQPGLAGCLTVVLVILLGVFQPVTPAAPWLIPASVLSIWFILAATRRLAPERGWIDRLGRRLAALWCVVGLICTALDSLGQPFVFMGYRAS